jgi:hypothetical protein
MLKFTFGLPAYDNNDQRSPMKWIKEWVDVLLKRIDDLDENDDQVINIIKHMVMMRPEDRFTADQCLQKGCNNGLFKRRSDGQIVDADASSKDEATEAATKTDTEIAVPDADTSDDGSSDDGAATSKQQSFHMTESGTLNASGATMILTGGL